MDHGLERRADRRSGCETQNAKRKTMIMMPEARWQGVTLWPVMAPSCSTDATMMAAADDDDDDNDDGG